MSEDGPDLTIHERDFHPPLVLLPRSTSTHTDSPGSHDAENKEEFPSQESESIHETQHENNVTIPEADAPDAPDAPDAQGKKRKKKKIPIMPDRSGTRYNSFDEFRNLHRAATHLEYSRQSERVVEFNKEELKMKAWVVQNPVPGDLKPWFIFRLQWPVEAKYEDLMPSVGERFRFRITSLGGKTSPWHFAERSGLQALDLNPSWDSTIEVRVAPEMRKKKSYLNNSDWLHGHWKSLFASPLAEQWVIDTCEPRNTEHIEVQVELRVTDITMRTEMDALSASSKILRDELPKKELIEYIVLMKKPSTTVDLTEIFTNLRRVEMEQDNESNQLAQIVKGFNEHQMRAFQMLKAIPAGLLFVPGGPGAGKTRWALSVIAMAQAGPEAPQVLCMMDINKTLDDAADRMFRLYKKLGLQKTAIRMFAWPREIQPPPPKPKERNNPKGTKTSEKNKENEVMGKENTPNTLAREKAKEDERGFITEIPFETDFTETFLKQVPIEPCDHLPADRDTAPNLDEAAWEYYMKHRDRFDKITAGVNLYLAGPANGDGETIKQIRGLREPLMELYREVLKKADFIATTPVAARNFLLGLLKPDLIFFDEAGHARELLSLVAITMFTPRAWIFTGDYRQVGPFVIGGRHDDLNDPTTHPLFHMSTMERFALNGAIDGELLINHRANSGLEDLPSKVFYNGAMIPAAGRPVPESVTHLLGYINNMRITSAQVPRMVVNIRGARWEADGKSSHNPSHHVWVMTRIGHLLRDPKFRTIDGTEPGRIMIIAPYLAATQRYQDEVDQFSSPEDAKRVSVRTINTAIGHESDVVFVDLVRGTRFTDDKRRLCVALTRAVQAEFVLLNSTMVTRKGQTKPANPNLFAV